MVATFRAPSTPPDAVVGTLRRRGYAVLAADDVATLCGVSLEALGALAPSWNDLPPDDYLRDGGRYRQRRHACFVVGADDCVRVPHRAHYQPLDYNALHGGLQRWFAPMAPATVDAPAWARMLRALGVACWRSMDSRSRRTYSGASNPRTGTLKKSGSPKYSLRSA